jgi:hypothetical protein
MKSPGVARHVNAAASFWHHLPARRNRANMGKLKRLLALFPCRSRQSGRHNAPVNRIAELVEGLAIPHRHYQHRDPHKNTMLINREAAEKLSSHRAAGNSGSSFLKE